VKFLILKSKDASEASDASLDFNIKIKLLKILEIPNLNILRIVFINEEKDEEKDNIYEDKVINYFILDKPDLYVQKIRHTFSLFSENNNNHLSLGLKEGYYMDEYAIIIKDSNSKKDNQNSFRLYFYYDINNRVFIPQESITFSEEDMNSVLSIDKTYTQLKDLILNIEIYIENKEIISETANNMFLHLYNYD